MPLIEGAAKTSIGGATTWVCTAPSGIQAGELIVARLRLTSGRAFNTPAGWTAGPTSGGASPLCSTFWKIAGASEPGTYSFTLSSGSLPGDAVVSRISGVDSTAPINAFAFSNIAGTNNASPWVAPSVSPSITGCLLWVDIGWVSVPFGQTFTPPGSMTQVYNVNAGTSNKAAGFSETLAESGATGTRSIAVSDNTESSLGLSSFVIAPALTPTTGQLWPRGKKGTPPTTGQTFPRGVTL